MELGKYKGIEDMPSGICNTGTFRCSAEGAKVIRMENSISVNKNSSGFKDDLMFKKRN